MIRKRTARLAATAVLGTAVLAGATGCGGPMQAGAALIVDGTRTTDGQIENQTTQITTLESTQAVAIGKLQAASQASPASPDAAASDQVNQLISEAVWQHAADALGLTVGADVDAKTRASLATNAQAAMKQAGTTATGTQNDQLSVFALGSGVNVAPGGMAAFIHYITLQQAVVQAEATKQNVDVNTLNSGGPLDQALSQLLATIGPQVKAKISPRYGTWDSLTGKIASPTPTWIREATAPVAPVQG